MYAIKCSVHYISSNQKRTKPIIGRLLRMKVLKEFDLPADGRVHRPYEQLDQASARGVTLRPRGEAGHAHPLPQPVPGPP